MANLQKPGENPDKPGEYIERGPRGGEVTDPRQKSPLSLEINHYHLLKSQIGPGKELDVQKNEGYLNDSEFFKFFK